VAGVRFFNGKEAIGNNLLILPRGHALLPILFLACFPGNGLKPGNLESCCRVNSLWLPFCSSYRKKVITLPPEGLFRLCWSGAVFGLFSGKQARNRRPYTLLQQYKAFV